MSSAISNVFLLFYPFFMPPEIKVLEADMLDLPFEDQCFDIVIEKGTMVE